MPTPGRGESRDSFLERCIPIVLDDGTAQDNDQAVAICSSMWDNQGAESEDTMSKDYRALPNFESKTIPTFVKAVDDKQGIVEHVVSVFGIRDLQGDRVMPGAFTKTIFERGQKVRVLDQHDASSVTNVVGKPIALREIGREELPVDVLTEYPEATGGLLATTQYAMATGKGRDVFHLVDGGYLPETSIGYDPITAEYIEETVDGQAVTTRLLKEIRLWEYSNVIWGANPATTTTGTKDAQNSTDTAIVDDPPRYVGGESDWMLDAQDAIKGASGSTSLPIADRGRAWDATAAQRRVRSWANAEDAPNARYRQAFFWYDSSAADQFGSYKLQFADVVDGTLTAIPRGVFAVAAVLQGSRGGVDIPSGDAAGVRTRVSRYYSRMRSQFDDDSIVPPWDKAAFIEGEELWLVPPKETMTSEEFNALPEHEKEWLWAVAVGGEFKAGRVFSARNVGRIRGALEAARSALADLDDMLEAAMPRTDNNEGDDEQAKDAPATESPDSAEAATGQDEQAGPPDQAPTSDDLLAEIESALKQLDQLSEE